MAPEPEEPIIILRTYYDPMLAHIVRTRLEDNGIPCTLDDSMMSVYPVYSNPLGGIKMRIFERDKAKAEAILAEDSELHVEDITDTDTTVVCPYCGSNNVRNALTVPDDANVFTRIVSAVANALPFDKEKDWHCFNCGKDF